jgi:predicted GNAT family acetyltransferase
MNTEIKIADGKVSCLEDDREIGRLDFKIQDNVMVIEHTRAFEKGKGVGRKLVVAAIEYAKDKGMKINPVCSFAYELMQRDEKYHELLVDEAGESLSCSL